MKISLSSGTLLVGCVLFMTACAGESASAETTDNKSTNEEIVQPDSEAPKEVVYAWLDPLNIRAAPDREGEVVAAVNRTQALELTGEKSNNSETIVLRGMAFEEPWLRVKTPDGTVGWVFGGAVKGKDEEKGTRLLDKSKIDFPHFGTYDLKDWVKIGTEDRSAGDAETIITTYDREDERLIVDFTEVGEYGYSRNYKLIGKDGKLLKSRELSFTVDPFLLTETVIDYSQQPAEMFARKQPMAVHFMQLNARPTLVNGPWQYTYLEE